MEAGRSERSNTPSTGGSSAGRPSSSYSPHSESLQERALPLYNEGPMHNLYESTNYETPGFAFCRFMKEGNNQSISRNLNTQFGVDARTVERMIRSAIVSIIFSNPRCDNVTSLTNLLRKLTVEALQVMTEPKFTAFLNLEHGFKNGKQSVQFFDNYKTVYKDIWNSYVVELKNPSYRFMGNWWPSPIASETTSPDNQLMIKALKKGFCLAHCPEGSYFDHTLRWSGPFSYFFQEVEELMDINISESNYSDLQWHDMIKNHPALEDSRQPMVIFYVWMHIVNSHYSHLNVSNSRTAKIMDLIPWDTMTCDNFLDFFTLDLHVTIAAFTLFCLTTLIKSWDKIDTFDGFMRFKNTSELMNPRSDLYRLTRKDRSSWSEQHVMLIKVLLLIHQEHLSYTPLTILYNAFIYYHLGILS
jgi:hypothetical protein